MQDGGGLNAGESSRSRHAHAVFEQLGYGPPLEIVAAYPEPVAAPHRYAALVSQRPAASGARIKKERIGRRSTINQWPQPSQCFVCDRVSVTMTTFDAGADRGGNQVNITNGQPCRRDGSPAVGQEAVDHRAR